jgi:hypothetical protein
VDTLKILVLSILAVGLICLIVRAARRRSDNVDPREDLATAQRQLEEAEHDLALIDQQLRQTHINTVQDACVIIAENARTEGLRALPTQGSDRELESAIADARSSLNKIAETARLNIELSQSLIDDDEEIKEIAQRFNHALTELIAARGKTVAVFARETDVPQALAEQLVAFYLRDELTSIMRPANLTAEAVAFLDDLPFDNARNTRKSTAILRDTIAQQIGAGKLVVVYNWTSLLVPGGGEIPGHVIATRQNLR